jgi:hypothetical protein
MTNIQGIQHFFGSLLTGGFDRSIVFNYFGFRTPEAPVGFELPAYFTEVLNIVKDNDDNFLTCTKTYKDSGSDDVTTTPFNIFAVTCASGIFKDYKFVKISYFPDFTRTVEISK